MDPTYLTDAQLRLIIKAFEEHARRDQELIELFRTDAQGTAAPDLLRRIGDTMQLVALLERVDEVHLYR